MGEPGKFPNTDPLGADNVVAAVDLVFSCRALEGEVRYDIAEEAPAGTAPPELRVAALPVVIGS